jgi:hypothetical protein
MKPFSFLIYFAALFFILASCANESVSRKYSDYQDANYNFTVSYPQDWDIKDEPESSSLFFNAPVKDEFSASFAIVTGEADPDMINIPQEFFEETANISYERNSLLELKKITFANEECLFMDYISESVFGEMRQKQYTFNRNGTLFVLIFASLDKNYKNYEKTFDKMAESFAFTDILQ